MVVAFYFRLHLAYFPRPVVAIFARPEHLPRSDETEVCSKSHEARKASTQLLSIYACAIELSISIFSPSLYEKPLLP